MNQYIKFILLSMFALFLTACQGTIAKPSASLEAWLRDLQGTVQARPSADAEFSPAVEDMRLDVQGQVKTLDDGRARLDISDGALVRMGPQTLFTLENLDAQPDGVITKIKLTAGEIWLILTGNGHIDVETPSGQAAVRGSFMSVSVDAQSGRVYLTCLEGNCTLENDTGQVEMVSGMAAMISAMDERPVMGVMNDQDIQRWMDVNPEAEAIMPVVEATMSALPPLQTMQPRMTNTAAPAATESPISLNSPTLTPTPSTVDAQGSVINGVPVPGLACLEDGSCNTYCGTRPVPRDCIDFFQAMQQIGVDAKACLSSADMLGCINQLVSQLQSIPVILSATPLPVHVDLPYLACIGSGDCDQYCAADPEPQDCADFRRALDSQNVNFELFKNCVDAGGDLQACADSAVRP